MKNPADKSIALRRALFVLALAAAHPLLAQSIDYNLPPAEPAPARPAKPVHSAGPADPAPVASAAPPPRATPAPQPSATAIPVIQPLPAAHHAVPHVPAKPLAKPVAKPKPIAAAPAHPIATPPVAVAAPKVSAAPTPLVPAPKTPAPVASQAAPPPLPAAKPARAASAPAAATTPSATLWQAIAGAAALLAGGLATALWRRGRRAPEPIAGESAPPLLVPEAAPETFAEPVQAAPVAAPPAPPPAPAAAPPALGITLEARQLNATLIATTLAYRLTLTNHGPAPLSALAIEGDLVSAHASLAPEAQIASAAQRLELRHALVSLAPGESAEFSGDLRLPLTAITPIRAGAATYLVPLARFRVESGAEITAQTFVIGERATGEDDAAALRPFRLDLGPRTYARLGQRAVG